MLYLSLLLLLIVVGGVVGEEENELDGIVFGGFRPPSLVGGNEEEGRIIGGGPASPGAYPYQVSLQVVSGGSRYHTCGGSILSPTLIATAAHCCAGQNKGNLRVVAGAQNIQTSEPSQQIAPLFNFTTHPNYNPRTMENDACQIVLSSPLQFNDRVNKISICKSEATSGNCVATGWGKTNSGSNTLPSTLQEVNLSIIQRSTCASHYASVLPLTPSMICAGGTEGKGGCNGDSGGPIVCVVGGEKCLAGSTSWGMQPCAQLRYPTVYANAPIFNSFFFTSKP